MNIKYVGYKHIETSRQKSISVNSILQFCNMAIACLIFTGLFREELVGHPYLDLFSLVLGLALCMQTYIALRMERSNSDPFVLIMAYMLIFFFSLRIFTLLMYPVQDVFLRMAYSPSDSNYAMLYILIANVFIYAGLFRIRLRGDVEINTSNIYPTKPLSGFVMFSIVVGFSQFAQGIQENIPPIVNLILNNFLKPGSIILVMAAYIIIFRKYLPVIYLKALLFAASILMILQTLNFSRSGILTFFDNIFIVVLALLPAVRIPRRFLVVAFALVPVIIVTSFTLYSISTLSRQFKENDTVTLSQKYELFQKSREAIENDALVEQQLGQIFSRMGYFDFSAEAIANSEHYSGLFTAENYLKSIVDNILTPGFDLFDQPLISNSLKYHNADLGNPSKKEESTGLGRYNTDQLGLYGEIYNIFGYASLIVLFAMSIFIKKCYCYIGRLNPFELALKNIFLLLMFYKLINSFGLDWIILDMVTTIISFWALSKLFRLRKSSRSNSAMHIEHMAK